MECCSGSYNLHKNKHKNKDDDNGHDETIMVAEIDMLNVLVVSSFLPQRTTTDSDDKTNNNNNNSKQLQSGG
jgi:hypothetical protein